MEWQQDRVQMTTPYTERPPRSSEMKENSPLVGMPTRNTVELNVGVYRPEQPNGWKSWGNQ